MAECMYYRVEGPYIVVVNGCKEGLDLKAVEVKYSVRVLKSEHLSGEVEAKTIRREITERITLGRRVAPGSSVEIYFGPVEDLDEVYAIIAVGDREYRIGLRRHSEKQD
ncbi:hypothetical protein CF15_06180 [Pyrodictium occultum]|uniref:Uncharacterized protein n=1 Tax=Pyrodictium occultum TaxID=2309 RepID=A0A0V8RW81_PYROC|nr:hypothetical protein CF15_06180 [Pyrodictium occultum]